MNALGRCGRILIIGTIMRRFGPSFVRPVYFIRKSTDFFDMWKDCQTIPIYFLLIISHKSPAIDNRFPLTYLLLIFFPWSLFFGWSVDGLQLEEVILYINRRGETWCWWWYLQRIGMIWFYWWYLLCSWLQSLNDLFGYCFFSLIWEVTKLTPWV